LQKISALLVVVLLLLFGVWVLLHEEPLAPIKVGVMHSLAGTMAISETPVMEATLFAINRFSLRCFGH